ncbi:MAG: L,D-transpeptidase [Thermoflexales bacterium]|nr:L,D-transpeptidase [Thermoflexales bacterium]MDW8351596.1 L,D-transpeptidase [Anaerolineae bacterium]
MDRIGKLFCVLSALLAALSAFALPPSPAEAAGRKRIVVVLREQRVYAYEGNTVVFATRANVRGAKRGNFRIRSKIPMAKSSVLGWKLPYWMGIYYVGRIENGFHGYSIRSNGALAANSLGCIVMPTPAAAWLYRWARIGTPVTIR